MITISRYTPESRHEWDKFVRDARNSTFLFLRDYMDYHADRFKDCSWIARKGSGIAAILPANVSEDGILHSHQGLTYGGWILPERHVDGADILDIFEAAIEKWKDEGYKALDYKPLPHIYSLHPSQEDEYALFRLGAVRTECNLSTAIPIAEICRQVIGNEESSDSPRSFYNKLRRRALSKSARLDFTIKEYNDAAPIMTMTTACLKERHDAAPVHSIKEMQTLKDLFPEQIRFWILEYASSPQAAVCIYDTGRVAHAQYIATTPLGRELDLLTPLFDYLINEIYTSHPYFDFGISNENRGQYLNRGLLRHKASFGATGVAYNRYFLDLA